MSSPPKVSPAEIFITHLGGISPLGVETFCSELARLLHDYESINAVHLMISTSGGDVNAGITLYNLLKQLPIELRTYNMGNVDSIGVVVFLASEERYMVENSSFVLHGIKAIKNSAYTLNQLREEVSVMEGLEEKITEILINETKFNKTDIEQYHARGSNIGIKEAQQYGLVKGIKKPPINRDSIQLVFGGDSILHRMRQ